MTNNTPARDNTIDIVAGILIIRMILGHYMTMCNLKYTMLFESLNSLFFYMPWFFYKSGLFCSNRKEPIAYLKTNLKKFIIPFVFFSLVGTTIAICSSLLSGKSIQSIIMSEGHSSILHGSTNWNGPLWFLISLCAVRVIYNYYRKYVNLYFLLAICFGLALVHYIFVSNYGIYWGGEHL